MNLRERHQHQFWKPKPNDGALAYLDLVLILGIERLNLETWHLRRHAEGILEGRLRNVRFTDFCPSLGRPFITLFIGPSASDHLACVQAMDALCEYHRGNAIFGCMYVLGHE